MRPIKVIDERPSLLGKLYTVECDYATWEWFTEVVGDFENREITLEEARQELRKLGFPASWDWQRDTMSFKMRGPVVQVSSNPIMTYETNIST